MSSPNALNATGNSTTDNYSFDTSQCKYHHAASGQCYVSDEHLLAEIQLYLQPSATEWVFLALYLCCFLLGLGGNGLVVWAVVRNSHLRSTTNVLLTNLALADFLAVLVCMPPNFVQTIWETWFLGEAMCKVVEYYQVSSGFLSSVRPSLLLRFCGCSCLLQQLMLLYCCCCCCNCCCCVLLLLFVAAANVVVLLLL